MFIYVSILISVSIYLSIYLCTSYWSCFSDAVSMISNWKSQTMERSLGAWHQTSYGQERRVDRQAQEGSKGNVKGLFPLPQRARVCERERSSDIGNSAYFSSYVRLHPSKLIS